MASLAEIRAKLEAIENRRSGGNQTASGDGTNFAFWNMDVGSSSSVRFLPDGNEDNTFFWVERQIIKLSFPGVKDGGSDFPTDKEVTIQVPCVDMWGDKCPVMREIGPWFDQGPELDAMARKYWKKRSYIFQGLVRENNLTSDNTPENPIRKFVVGPQIYKIVKAALMDVEMEESPTDYEAGTDFRILKEMKGSGVKKYNDYTSSNWARRESALTEEEREAIEKFGLVDLSTYLPKRPSAEAAAAIFEMFEASVEGELYDPERWGQFYRPYGLEVNTPAKRDDSPSEDSKPVYQEVPAEKVAEEAPAQEEAKVAEPVAAEEGDGEAKSAQDILAMIRNR